MTAVSLLTLRTSARQRADMEDDDQLITSSEANGLINLAIGALWDLILESPGQSFIRPTTVTFSTPSTSPNQYSLSSAYKVLRVEYWTDANGTYRIPLRPAMNNEIPYLMSIGNSAISAITGDALYSLYGGIGSPTTGGLIMETYPPPQPTQYLAVVYYPPPPTLSADGDTFLFPNGWEDYVIVFSAIKMLRKEESNTAPLQTELNELVERIRNASKSLDEGQPQRAQDVVYQPRYPWPFGWGS